MGFAVTVIDAVSLQPVVFVHRYLYVPALVKFMTLVDELVGMVMVEFPGLPGMAVHVPVPVADMVARPPGRAAQVTV